MSLNFKTYKHTSISNFIDIGLRSDPLGKGPQSSSDAIKRLETLKHVDGHHFYGVTITFSPKCLRKKNIYISDYIPQAQFNIMAPIVDSMFEDFIYCFWAEWTKKGLIHFHGVVAHPMYKIENSLVLHSIRKVLRTFGKMNDNSSAVNSVSDFRKFLEYCSKEDNQIIYNEPESQDSRSERA